MFGEEREYLTIKILHNDMTVMVPCCNASKAGLRRIIDDEAVKKVMSVLQDDLSEMPKNWNRRFKHNRDKIKTGDIYELAEVVRNLAIREFNGLDEILAATDSELENIDGVGDMRAKDIREGLRRLQEINLVDRYLQT
jgi:RNA polymerase-interacting CarD/CdnL/TRCF family regulator